MTEPGGVANDFSGVSAGNVVQAGTISGGVHFHQPAPAPGFVDRQRLQDALLALTVPVVIGDETRSGFPVAPGRLATYGTETVVLERTADSHVVLCGAVEPEDELWAFGFPTGAESAEIVGLRCPAVLGAHSPAHPVTWLWGPDRDGGLTGGPVLNWRTGAVCGLLLVTESGLWLVPAGMVEEVAERAGATPIPDDRAWLNLLDDGQLLASGRRYPGARLRTFLAEVRQVGEGHPYRPMVEQGPSLTSFYLPQHLHGESEGTHRISAEELAERHDGAQVIGDPGVGKSSLVRHLAAECATRWLTDGTGSYVPIPVSARALAGESTLPRLLTEGVIREITTVIDVATLTEMFGREPIQGVPWLVLVDGLDEVLNNHDRERVLGRVLSQRDRSPYRFVVTSRPLGNAAFTRLAKRFPTYRVELFDDDELARFARAWFDDVGQRDPGQPDAATLVDQFMAQVARSGLDRLARIPLVSMMLCIVFVSDRSAGLPNTLYAVYERFFAVLADKLDASGAREQFRAQAATFGPDAEAAVARMLTGLPTLLSTVARARHGVRRGEYPDTRPILTQAVDLARPGRPEVVPEDAWDRFVAEALRASGLMVHRGDDFRFLHQTVEEYLAAKHLAESAGRGDRREMLAPQATWPWKHLEIKIFVVALWTTKGVDLTPQLTRLLGRRHRQANAGFVIELARRGVPLPDRVRALARDVLIERIHSARAMFRDWLEAVLWLRDLEPDVVGAELERLVRDQADGDRAVEAVRELLTFDREGGLAMARWLLGEPATAPGNRFKLAEHVLGVDRELGLTMLTELTSQPGLRMLAVDAAIKVADADPERGHHLLRKLATTRRAGGVQVAAARTLLNRVPGIGIGLLDQIWNEVSLEPDARLELTKLIAQISGDAAGWRLFELAGNPRLSSALRMTAGAELKDLDPARYDTAMALLAGDEKIPVRDRITSALRHSDPGTGAELLVRIAETDPSAIGHATSLGPEWHTWVLLRVVQTGGMDVDDQLDGIRRLMELGHGAGTETVLESITGPERGTDAQRMTAAGLLDQVDASRAMSAYTTIALDDKVATDQRIEAADAVRRHSPQTALRLYVAISETFDLLSAIDAATKAGEIDTRAGFDALGRLARSSSESRFYSAFFARAMLAIDEESAVSEWRNLRSHLGPSKSIRAAARRSRDG